MCPSSLIVTSWLNYGGVAPRPVLVLYAIVKDNFVALASTFASRALAFTSKSLSSITHMLNSGPAGSYRKVSIGNHVKWEI
jgi:hypothetical protein